MENKKIINILAASGIIVIFFSFFLDYKCLFKNIFNIPCVSCGLTRGFKYILELDLINAFKSNLLSIPIFIFTIIFYFLYFVWGMFKKKYIFVYYNYFVKHYKFMLFILLINWIINIIK